MAGSGDLTIALGAGRLEDGRWTIAAPEQVDRLLDRLSAYAAGRR